MRRRIQTIHTKVSTRFNDLLERERRRLNKQLNFRRDVTKTELTEMLVRSGKLKIPRLNINLFKNVKRKKG